MSNPPEPTSGTFQARAAAATARALSASNPAEALAQSLTADVPKITDAAKSYASLVAARSLCTSGETDAATTSTDASAAAVVSADGSTSKCTFHKTANPAKASLLCARALLLAINSTNIPANDSNASVASCSTKNQENNMEQNLEKDVVRIVWNGLVKKTREQASGGGVAATPSKPSKILGHRSLVHAYPHVMERLRRGQEGGDGGEASLLPAGVDHDDAMAFFKEFGRLLVAKSDATSCTATMQDDHDEDDDGELIWSTDGGASELGRRRERRAQRGKEAAAAAEADAKAKVAASAIGMASSVTIEEIREAEEEAHGSAT